MKRFAVLGIILLLQGCSANFPREYKLAEMDDQVVYDVALPDSIPPSHFADVKLYLNAIGSGAPKDGLIFEVGTSEERYPWLHILYLAKKAPSSQRYEEIVRQILWLGDDLKKVLAQPNAAELLKEKPPRFSFVSPYFVINYGDSTFTLDMPAGLYAPELRHKK